MLSYRRGTWFLATLTVVLACGRTVSDPADVGGWSRMIAEEPQRLLEFELLHHSQVSWTFENWDSSPWSVVRGEAKVDAQGHLVGRPHNNLLRLRGRLGTEAAELGGLRINFAENFKGSLSVLWRHRSKGSSDGRSESSRQVRSAREIDLHREGIGPVETVELSIWTKAGEVTLTQIQSLAPVALGAEDAASSWKVELGNDVRPALLAPSGVERRWNVEVPSGRPLLRLGVGVEAGTSVPTTFTIHDLSGNGPRILASHEVGGIDSATPSGRWHDLTIDLRALAGRSADLSFQTSRPASERDHGGMAFWGNPTILTPPRRRRPNVVLISLDTLRADRLSLYGHARSTSPRLDAWAARRAVTFESAVAPSPWTLPSHISLLSGLDAVRHGLNFNDPVPPSLTLLPRRLREAGYRTRAVTGGGFLSPRFGFHRGFDSYRSWSPALNENSKKSEIEWQIPEVLGWLDDPPAEPFFLFLHTYQIHGPYEPHEPFFARFDRGIPQLPVEPLRTSKVVGEGFRVKRQLVRRTDLQPLPASGYARAQDLYDAGIAYTDSVLGRLLERLEAPDLAENTLVIVTSDHGEALGERNGLAGHSYLYDFNLLVPLVIAFPGGEGAGSRFAPQVRSVDVLPTVLDVVGLPLPDPLDGVSLLPAARGFDDFVPSEAWSYAAASNYGVSLRIANRRKMILSNSAWSPYIRGREMFLLDSDPDEAHNLTPTTAGAARLARRIEERLERESPSLRCRFANGGADDFAAALAGENLTPSRIKTLDLSGPLVRWEKSAGATVEVPAGSAFTLFLESRPSERLLIRIDGDFESSVDLGSLPSEGWRAVRTETGWTTADDSRGSSGEVACRWRGRVFEDEPSLTGELSAELEEQLRALGYL